MKLLIIIVVLISLNGCKTPPERIMGPNGKMATLLTCSKIQECYSESLELCPNGYVILNQSGSGAVNHINTGYVQYYTVDDFKLFIECK